MSEKSQQKSYPGIGVVPFSYSHFICEASPMYEYGLAFCGTYVMSVSECVSIFCTIFCTGVAALTKITFQDEMRLQPRSWNRVYSNFIPYVR